MSLYPSILPLHAYRYTPFKDEMPLRHYIDFVCIRWISESEYILMVIKDKLECATTEGEEWLFWQYGDVKIQDWHVDLKEIEVRICDIKFAKLQGL